ncbi:MAG: FAD-dependent oxidoreductase [bacterium]
MRIKSHPVLDFTDKKKVSFLFNGKELYGFEGEPIISALRANDILKTRYSAKQHKPLGPFCMQGRCGNCMMTVDGNPNTMACITPLAGGMDVRYQGSDIDVEVFKRLPRKAMSHDVYEQAKAQEHPVCEVAIIGAGPAGLEAALTCSEAGVKDIFLLDDKQYIGGQLVLQTHTFFGNEELGASKRGFKIAQELADRVSKTNIHVRLNSTVVGMYPGNILAFRDNDKLNFLIAKKIIVCTGAMEKNLPFEGNYIPGIIGAGGAQTFMNLYGVKPGEKVLVVGGGNIGVIVAYQLLQAGSQVVAVIEAQNKFGAYKVHVDKVAALGVPMLASHTILKAVADKKGERVASAVIAQLDDQWNVVKGSEKTVDCDTICMAVGLNPLNELLWQAGCDFKFIPELGEAPIFDKFHTTSNPDIYVAGDCAVIGEASIARLEGKLSGLKAALDLGYSHPKFEEESKKAFRLLDNIQSGSFGARLGIGKKKLTGEGIKKDFVPNQYTQGLSAKDFKAKEARVIIDCPQDIPCNPCEMSCPARAIIVGDEINQQPNYDPSKCVGCGKCLAACPGRAILLVQYNYTDKTSRVCLPFEFLPEPKKGELVELLDKEGSFVCKGTVLATKFFDNKERCSIVEIELPKDKAFSVRSYRLFNVKDDISSAKKVEPVSNSDVYVCRCEEITEEMIIDLIKKGYRSVNEIKRITRLGMGPCRGNQCRPIVENLLKKYSGKTGEEILDVKLKRRTIYRAPTKRITLGEAAGLNFSKDELETLTEIEHTRTVQLEILNTFRSPYLTEKKHISKKVVIIGGGINGINTAWQLAKQGWSDIVVVEKEFLASGASGAALGGIRTGFSESNKIKRSQYGLDFYKNAEKNIGKPVGWYQGGYVYLAFDKKTYDSFAANLDLWEKEGIKAEFTTDIAKISKWLPGLETSSIMGAVLFPEAGGANPFASAYGIAEDAKAMGVEFIIGDEVADIMVEKGQVKGCITASGLKINCEYIVNAAGSYAVRVSKMAGVDLGGSRAMERGNGAPQRS